MLADRVAARVAVRNAADPVTLEEFGAMLGQTNGTTSRSRAGTTMSPQRALGISAWYSGVRYISEVMAGLPIHRFRRLPGDGRERRTPPAWMTVPDVEQPWYGLVEYWLMSLLHRGNAYAFKVRNPAGQVYGLREIHPDRVTVGQAPDGTKRFVIDKNERLWTTREVLHIPGLAYDGRVGMNPIRCSADALGTVAATDEYAARFFTNNTNLGGIISVEHAMTGTEAKALKAEWEDFHQGILNAHRTGVLSKGARYDRVTLNAEDSQLIEARQYGVAEIARLLRLPPHKLYELSRATFSNIEHQSIEVVVDSVTPWVRAFEEEADYKLFGQQNRQGMFTKMNMKGLLRGDNASRAQFYTAMFNLGALSPNEIRELEDMNGIGEDGNQRFRSQNLAPLNAEDAAALMAPAQTAEPAGETPTDTTQDASTPAARRLLS